MEKNKTKVLGLGTIIVILIAVALLAGFLLGLMGTLFDLPPSMTTSGVGVSVGIVAVVLLNRRRAALAERNKP